MNSSAVVGITVCVAVLVWGLLAFNIRQRRKLADFNRTHRPHSPNAGIDRAKQIREGGLGNGGGSGQS